MVTRGFINSEISRLEYKISEAREKYGYSGSPSTLKTIERDEDMIQCLQYALAHKNDRDEGYRTFSISAKMLHENFTKIVNSDISTDDKFTKIEKAINGLSYWQIKMRGGNDE